MFLRGNTTGLGYILSLQKSGIPCPSRGGAIFPDTTGQASLQSVHNPLLGVRHLTYFAFSPRAYYARVTADLSRYRRTSNSGARKGSLHGFGLLVRLSKQYSKIGTRRSQDRNKLVAHILSHTSQKPLALLLLYTNRPGPFPYKRPRLTTRSNKRGSALTNPANQQPTT